MALGDTRGNGQQQRQFDPEYYSRVRFNHYEEKLSLSINYSTGMMKLIINKSNDQTGRPEAIATLWLTPKKAKLLVGELDAFNEEFTKGKLSPNKAFGITTGVSDVSTVGAFHVNADGGRAFTVAKVDASGTIQERYEYNFAKDSDFSVRWDNFDAMKMTKEYNNDIDIMMLRDALENFSYNGAGGASYVGLDLGRYETRSRENKLNAIAAKLGIETNRSNNYNRERSGNNFFNGMNPPQGSSDHKSFNDIESMIAGEDEELA